jgi:hypothetical protein
MELVSCHHSGAKDFEMAPRFYGKFVYCHIVAVLFRAFYEL